jgi:hypothetical protein
MVNGAAPARQLLTVAEVETVRAQVHRICASRQFASAGKLARFLEYVVEATLQDAGTPAKEYSIGVGVYGRPADYDPRVDSIVRVEAGKLRSRLAQYYDESGRDSPVRISVPKGGYVPIFDFVLCPVTAPTHKAHRVKKPLAFPKSPTLALFLAGTAIVTFLIAYSNRGAVATPRYSRLEPLSAGRRVALDPSPSPDGRSVA